LRREPSDSEAAETSPIRYSIRSLSDPDKPDRPAGDFLASLGSRLKRRSYGAS